MRRCFKCQQGVGTVVSRDGPSKLYCADCFLAYCAAAVRENLFQYCRAPSDTPMAVAVSGGPNSMMLLRELGQLRCKAEEQLCLQQQYQQRIRSAGDLQNGDRPESNGSFSSTPRSLASRLVLLPFYLREEEILLPPAPTSSSLLLQHGTASEEVHRATAWTASGNESRARQAAMGRVRATMQSQFDLLRGYVQAEPQRWLYRNERTSKLKKRLVTNTKATDGPTTDLRSVVERKTSPEEDRPQGCSEEPEEKEQPVHLFGAAEVRIFCYSDFLPTDHMEELRHALHAGRLSLSDRETLYALVRQQTLCRAAQRVCAEYKWNERIASAPEQATTELKKTCAETEPAPAASSALAWSHLLVGSNAVRCATAALEALVTGAGGEGVVHDSDFRGFAHEVVSLRPLRTLLPKESVMYTRLQGILCGYTPALRTCTTAPSVNRTLEHFVLTMMGSYRTMIFNVLNTVQKLELHPTAMQQLVRGAQMCHPSPAKGKTGIAKSLSPKRGRGAPPARTAQQNRDDLRLTAPPLIRRSASDKAADVDDAIALCHLCGRPTHLSTAGKDSPHDTVGRSLDILPLEQASSTTSDWLVCHACQSLAQSWPESILYVFDAESTDRRTTGGSTASLAARTTPLSSGSILHDQ